MKNLFRLASLHSAGASIQHRSPFNDIEVSTTENTLSEEFCRKWVAPFYMSGPNDKEFRDDYLALRAEVTPELIGKLLTEFNWRTRIVGAYFAAIENCLESESHLGKLLLRSDVCYAGSGYCLALAAFNSETSTQYLTRYLDYYLSQKNLWFEQADCMASIAYLDRINGTSVMEEYTSSWTKFVKNKPNWNLKISMERFSDSMDNIYRLRESA